MLKILPLVFAYLTIVACSPTIDPSSPINPIRTIDSLQDISDNATKLFITLPSPHQFSICYGHSCNKFGFVSLSEQQWQTVTAIFEPTATSAQQERELIKHAIALLERLSGQQVGTDKDLAENAIYQNLNGQLDCIDEATNTTVYLRLLYDADLLKYHQQSSRTARGGLLAPHNTATITENGSSQRYAVDSWFYDNGQPPVIVPLAQWKKGWKPAFE